MLESEATDVVDHGNAGYLGADLPCHQLQQHVGRGVVLLHRDCVGVPTAQPGQPAQQQILRRHCIAAPDGYLATLSEVDQ